ncbi:RNA-directed DNA polymerase, eukaryota, reverse transcriptase zinc-binding domain protein [Tanacetum coccineum]
MRAWTGLERRLSRQSTCGARGVGWRFVYWRVGRGCKALVSGASERLRINGRGGAAGRGQVSGRCMSDEQGTHAALPPGVGVVGSRTWEDSTMPVWRWGRVRASRCGLCELSVGCSGGSTLPVYLRRVLTGGLGGWWCHGDESREFRPDRTLRRRAAAPFSRAVWRGGLALGVRRSVSGLTGVGPVGDWVSGARSVTARGSGVAVHERLEGIRGSGWPVIAGSGHGDNLWGTGDRERVIRWGSLLGGREERWDGRERVWLGMQGRLKDVEPHTHHKPTAVVAGLRVGTGRGRTDRELQAVRAGVVAVEFLRQGDALHGGCATNMPNCVAHVAQSQAGYGYRLRGGQLVGWELDQTGSKHARPDLWAEAGGAVCLRWGRNPDGPVVGGDVLTAVGFLNTMIKWIMTCITFTKFSICVNGEINGYFNRGRGLRQWDPISPHLFTPVIDVFNMIMIKNVKESGRFRYHHRCKELKLTHMCLADDLLVLCKGDTESVKVVRKTIEDFSKVSGLFLNISKSTIFFGNVKEEDKADMLQVLPFKVWKTSYEISRHLSYAGRIQLIAYVLSTMQQYWASVYMLPDTVIKDLDKLFKMFIWNAENSAKGKARVAWNLVCRSKEQGGLGIKPLKRWNEEIVYVDSNSCGWKNMLELRDKVKDHVIFQDGNGKAISAWYDKWCKLGPLTRFIPNKAIFDARMSEKDCLADIISEGKWAWLDEWEVKYLEVKSITVPTLNDSKDGVKWVKKSKVVDKAAAIWGLRWNNFRLISHLPVECSENTYTG